MKMLITIVVWFFVPLLLVETAMCNCGPRGASAAAHDLAAMSCSGAWPISGTGVASAPSGSEC